jgi:hypothetical protein
MTPPLISSCQLAIKNMHKETESILIKNTFLFSVSFIVFRKPSPMAMVPQEGNSNTPCFLLPPFQGEIKPPA